jgi:predicted Ser/Thr protein kinase
VLDIDDANGPDVIIVGFLQNFMLGLFVDVNLGNGTLVDQRSVYFPTLQPDLAFANTNFADFNNDGYVDMLLTGAVFLSIIIGPEVDLTFYFTGAGPNTPFVNATEMLPPMPPMFFGSGAAADFDGDGDLDFLSGGQSIALISSNGPANQWFLRNNGHNFTYSCTSYPEIPLLTKSRFVAVDFDNDNVEELVVTGISAGNSFSLSSFYRINPNNGSLTMFTVEMDGLGFASIVTKDINGDGKLDMAVAGQSTKFALTFVGRIYVFVWDSDRNTLVDQSKTRMVKNDQCLLGATTVVSDFNNDECEDVLLSGFSRLRGQSQMQIFSGDCHGNFTLAATLSESQLMYAQISSQDFDLDGSKDLFISGASIVLGKSAAFRWLLLKQFENTLFYTDVSFSAFPEHLVNETSQCAVGSVSALDANRDGYMDLFVTGEQVAQSGNYSRRYFLLNLRNMSFSDASNLLPVTAPSVSYSCALKLDLNNDGVDDLIYSGIIGPLNLKLNPYYDPKDPADFSSKKFAMLGLGNGSFVDASDLWSPDIPSYVFCAMELRSLDNSGLITFAMTGISRNYAMRLYVLTVAHNGTIFPNFDILPYNLSMWSSTPHWVDYDSDGLLDLICSGSGTVDILDPSASLAVLRNFGNGTLVDVTESTGLYDYTSGLLVGTIASVPIQGSAPLLLMVGTSKCSPHFYYQWKNDSVVPDDGGGSKPNTGAIVGGVLGSILGACLMLSLCGCCILCCCVCFAAVVAAVFLLALVAMIVIATVAGGAGTAIAGGAGFIAAKRMHGGRSRADSVDASTEDEGLELEAMLSEAMAVDAVTILPPDDVRVIRKIGEGSFGEVLLCEWNGVEVAMKNFPSMDSEAVREVLHEALMMSKVSHHPHIVQLIGVVRDAEHVGLVMNFCSGGSLYKNLTEHRLDEAAKIRALREVASALAFLHRLNIVHRDVAARNVLLEGSGAARLSDLGLSRITEKTQSEQRTASSIGPVRWMAPESLRNHVYSSATDAYAFGVLMFEVWSDGATPYGDLSSLSEVAMQVLQNDLRPSVPSAAPPDHGLLMRRLWARNASDRPSMEAVHGLFGRPVDIRSSQVVADFSTADEYVAADALAGGSDLYIDASGTAGDTYVDASTLSSN